MTIFKKFISLLIITLLAACSTTAEKDYSVIEREYMKKPLISDHHLKMSLLNRPIPQDQLMMMAFAQTRGLNEHYTDNNMIAQVGYIEIKGQRLEDKTDVSNNRRVIGPIAQDNNAISILGPNSL